MSGLQQGDLEEGGKDRMRKNKKCKDIMYKDKIDNNRVGEHGIIEDEVEKKRLEGIKGGDEKPSEPPGLGQVLALTVILI